MVIAKGLWSLLHASPDSTDPTSGLVSIALGPMELDRHSRRVRFAIRGGFKGFASQAGLNVFDIADNQPN